MSQGTEVIEAKLAAYIDGTLGPKEHAEIEKFLIANPSHRQLIEELKVVKKTLGGLPQEDAPLEIMDHLQSHLERGALLDHASESTMRINRWPQLAGVAAVLFLTAGLGMLIYKVLPSGAINHDDIAYSGEAAQIPSIPTMRESDATTQTAPTQQQYLRQQSPASPLTPAPIDGVNDQSVRSRDLNRAEEAIGANAPMSAAPGAKESPKDLMVQASPPIEETRVLEATGNRSDPEVLAKSRTTATENKIVVETDDPALSQNLIAGYLAQNSVPYETPNAAPAEGHELRDAATQTAHADVANALKQSAARSDAVIVLRNVSPAQAGEINRAIASQRNGRQTVSTAGDEKLWNRANAAPAQASARAKAEDAAPAAAMEPITLDTPPATPSTTQSAQASMFAADKDDAYELKIIVRAAPATQPTDPATQPATTQPATMPTTQSAP